MKAPISTRPQAPGTARLALVVLLAVVGCSAVRAPFDGARLYARGSDALDADRPDQAVADLEAAARLLPEASEVHNHLGLAYAESGRDGEALAAFQRAVDLDCDNEAAQHNLRAAQAGRFRPAEEADE